MEEGENTGRGRAKGSSAGGEDRMGSREREGFCVIRRVITPVMECAE
jgi:hypothetical protein